MGEKRKKVHLGQKRLDDGTVFYYLSVGQLAHGREQYRIWIARRLVEFDNEGKPYLTLPKAGVDLQKTEKGTLKLVPGGRILYDIFVPCGYRGGSRVKPVNVDEKDIVLKYNVFASERGSLGISEGALVVTDKDRVVVQWTRSGRLYGGAPKGVLVVTSDGKETTIEDIEAEDLRELEGL